MPPSPAGEGFGGGRFVKRPYEEMGNRDLIRPSVRTGAPSPPGEGFAGCRGRQPLQEHGAAGRPLRHPAGRDTPGDISPCAGAVIRAAEGVGPYGDMGGRGAFPLSVNRRTRRLTAPPRGSQVACAPFWQGGHCGGRAVLLVYIISISVYIFWFT